MDGAYQKQFNKIFYHRFLLVGWVASVLFLTLPLNAERLPFKIYTTENGLPQNITNRVMSDSHGFLWFSTEDGLSRFDGQVFVNYDTTDGLPHPQINHILEARDGSFWVATYGGGVVRLDVAPKPIIEKQNISSFTPIPIIEVPEKQIEANRAIYLFQDRAETMWLGTFNGLFRLENDGERLIFRRVKLLSNDAPFIIRGLTEDRNNNLWIWTRNGVLRRQPDGKTTHFPIRAGDNYDPIRQILCDQNNKIWIAHEQAGLIVLDADKAARFVNSTAAEIFPLAQVKTIISDWYGKANKLTDDRIFSLFQSSDGHLWIGTESGITEFDGKQFQNHTAAQGLPETPYNWLAEDINGNIWATTNQGAVKLTRHGFVTFQQAEGIGVRGVRSIWENADGKLQILTPDGEFHQLAGQSFVSVQPILPSGTTFEFPQNVIQDSQGKIWTATKNGLFRFSPPSNFAALAQISPQKIKGLPSDFIMNLYEDSRQDLWISLANGGQKLVRWERKTNTLHFFDETDGVPSDFVAAAFVEDAAGTLWSGNFGGGLLRYRNGRFDYFPTADDIEFGQAQTLLSDDKGFLWMGTKGGGVWKISELAAEKPIFSQLTTKNGLASDNVTSLTEDMWGRIYVGTGRGIDWLDPKSENIGHYSTVDGLNDNKIEISFRDRQGALWFGTANSLAKFVPLPPQSSLPPPIFITNLQIGGKNVSLSEIGQTEVGEFELDAGAGQVMIEFSGINFNAGQTLQFQHKLVGTEENWGVPTRQRTVNFANLASGNYQFLVRAITSDGEISQKPAVVNFKILPPLYLRWWFLMTAVLFVGIIIYAFYRSRLARLLELERVRTRIATDLHDDIGANLTRIALLSEVANQQTGNGNRKNLLPSIADIARESVDSMNDIVWAISPNHDRLLDLTRRMRQHAEEIFTYREIDLEFNAPPSDTHLKLSVGVRRDLLLIFKEAVNNAARHSGCSKVKIDFRLENSMLSLHVADNGRGFDDSQESDGQGLRSMSRRAEFLGGKFKVDSRQKNGTSIEFELALQKTKQT